MNEPAGGYDLFLSEVSATLAPARSHHTNPDRGLVAVLPVTEARGLHFDHVVLLGMSEGAFPPAPADPPLYSRRERALLAQRGWCSPARPRR
ncbi:MAG: hypothetical protein HC884_11120 [Chloroflexaceae bacterium]|nr:hypothetical protein [Chloroflexaceae bacterium]